MRKIASLEDIIGIEYGKIGYYQDLQQNLTRLRIINQELQESRTEIETILNGITDMMMVLTIDLKIVRTNREFQETFQNIDSGSHCYDFFTCQDGPCVQCPALKALEENRTIRESRIHDQGRGFYHYDITAAPLLLNNTRTVQVFYRDVTRDKQLQAKYKQAEKMATVGVLAAGVAHEINNPLAAIQGFAQGLQRRIKRPEQNGGSCFDRDFAEYIETILSECSRCRDIVRNLLNFSRPIATQYSLLDINRCIRDTLFILKHHLEEQPLIWLELELSDSLPCICGDESQLKQVIINLCTNAVDAMKNSGGSLFVSSRSAKRHDNGECRTGIEFSVRDEGGGIAPDIQEKLFEPFFTTKNAGEGVGIGLSTCYSIVVSHQGEIRVESELGKGATFIVFLPEEQL